MIFLGTSVIAFWILQNSAPLFEGSVSIATRAGCIYVCVQPDLLHFVMLKAPSCAAFFRGQLHRLKHTSYLLFEAKIIAIQCANMNRVRVFYMNTEINLQSTVNPGFFIYLCILLEFQFFLVDQCISSSVLLTIMLTRKFGRRATSLSSCHTLLCIASSSVTVSTSLCAQQFILSICFPPSSPTWDFFHLALLSPLFHSLSYFPALLHAHLGCGSRPVICHLYLLLTITSVCW